MKTERGFTLIELLVVIAIIGVLSSVVLASLSSARLRARDSAVKAGVRQLASMVHVERNDTGSFANLQSGWDYTASDCNNSFAGTHAANARQICASIVANGGSIYTGNNVSLATEFSIMALLPSTGRYYCVGSSGRTSDTETGSTWGRQGVTRTLSMKVLVATDHTGFVLKNTLVEYVRDALLYEVEDLGAFELNQDDDYPDLIRPCAEQVATSSESLGIVIGGSGQGEAMVANKISGVRAAVFYGQCRATRAVDAEGAPSLDGFDIVRLAREHNDANVLSLGARFVSEEDAKEAVRIFLETPFTGVERHRRRIGKIR